MTAREEDPLLHIQRHRAENGGARVVVVISVVVALGGVIGGYSHGFPSPTLLDLQREYERGERVSAFSSSSVYAGIFGAIGPIGGLFGGSIAGPVSDKIGRSAALVLMMLPHLVGWLAQAYAHWVPSASGFLATLMLGRWCTGFGTGWGSLVISVYLVEISPTKLKGLFGSVYWFSTSLGILLVYILGTIPGFMYYDISLSTAGLVVPCTILYCFLPESPRWLVSQRRTEEAYSVLKFMRGKGADVSTEMKELQLNFVLKEDLNWRSKIKLLSQASAYKPLLLTIFLMLFQQFTGSNVVLFYAGTILTDARVVNAKEVAGYAVGTTQVVAVLLSLLIVDWVGRKALLLISSFFVCFSTGMLGFYYFLTDYVCVKYYHVNTTTYLGSPAPINTSGLPLFCDPITSDFFVLAIFSVILFIVSYSLGWSTIPWIMMSELSPLKVRGVLSGVATTVNWSAASLVTGLFPVYQNTAHHYGSWWTLTAITLLSIPYVIIFIPETKGRSLEEIERRLGRSNQSSESTAEVDSKLDNLNQSSAERLLNGQDQSSEDMITERTPHD